LDVTNYATFQSSDPAVATLAANANGLVWNRIRPSALGAAAISATLGNRTVVAPVSVISATAISAITLQPLFNSDGVNPADPSILACPRTFRGDIGTSSELLATFHFSDNDNLACPVTMPIGSLSRAALQDDYLTLQSVLSNLTSDRAQSVAVVPPDWSPPHPSGFDLMLQDSSPGLVAITATSTCVAAGAVPPHAFPPLSLLPHAFSRSMSQ
jgi:hypothetical protein